MEKLRHVALVVDDLQEAIKWYAKFDFYPLQYESVKINGRAVQLCKLAHIEGTEIELLDGATAVPHVSFSVNKLLFDMLEDEYNAKMFNKEGVCYIKDPWGNVLEIVESRGY